MKANGQRLAGPDPWTWPETAQAYVHFCRQHDRYRVAARALARSLELRAGARVRDVAAGTGVSTRALLEVLPADGRLVAVEPSAAMRAAAGIIDPRVEWLDSMPPERFDAVVCSAAIWLLNGGEVGAAIAGLAARVAERGALVFSVPAGYVGLPDGCPDDRVDALNALVAAFVAARARDPEPTAPFPDHVAIDGSLRDCGLSPVRTEAAAQWTFATQRDWLLLPPVGLAMRPDLRLAGLEAAVAAAMNQVSSQRGRRTERWAIWSATR